jgi:hypothetical protein
LRGDGGHDRLGDLVLGVVDPAVGRDHAFGGLEIALRHRPNGVADLRFDQRAHAQDAVLDDALLAIKGRARAGLLGTEDGDPGLHVGLHHPNLPEM